MNIPCPVASPCPLDTPPYLNLSAEEPDRDIFIGLSWGNPQVGPPLGSNWSEWSCMGQCDSTISQDDADACAFNASLACDLGSPNPGVNPPINPFTRQPYEIFYNHFQSCSFTCPDGHPFTSQVPAGTFAAMSQFKADQIAYSYCVKNAGRSNICLGEMSRSEFCVNDDIIAAVSASGHGSNSTNVWTVIGSLPPGTSLSVSPDAKTASIAGVATTGGTYTFDIRVEDAAGNWFQKTFTICVIAITPDTLPDGTISVVYSQILSATGCATPALSWQVFSGTLPTGLTLAEDTGILSGTPTVAGTYNFTILLQTKAT